MVECYPLKRDHRVIPQGRLRIYIKDPLEKVGSIIIKAIGEDPTQEGRVKTPQRFAGALRTILSGYERTAEDVVGEGISASESTDPIMVLRMKFFSICEHHLLPFFG